MANNNPSPSTRFRAGNQMQKKVTKESRQIAAMKVMSAKELADICDLIMHANRGELEAVLQDPNTPMIKVNLISAILADTSKGLTYTLDKLLERTVGKPKDRIELSGDPDNPMALQAVQVVISLPDNGRSGE